MVVVIGQYVGVCTRWWMELGLLLLLLIIGDVASYPQVGVCCVGYYFLLVCFLGSNSLLWYALEKKVCSGWIMMVGMD